MRFRRRNEERVESRNRVKKSGLALWRETERTEDSVGWLPLTWERNKRKRGDLTEEKLQKKTGSEGGE